MSVFGLRAEAEVRGGVRALVILGLLLPGNASAAARAGHRLDVGDVIEVSIAGVPDLQRRLPIQLDGTISFPMLGTITVAGLSPLEVQARIQAGLARQGHSAPSTGRTRGYGDDRAL